MTAVNYEHVLDQLTGHGLLPATVKGERGGYYDGGLVVDSAAPVRCNTDDDAREQRGWYWLSTIDLPDHAGKLERCIIGAFGIWHGNDDGKTALKLDRTGRPALTADETAAIATCRLTRIELATVKPACIRPVPACIRSRPARHRTGQRRVARPMAERRSMIRRAAALALWRLLAVLCVALGLIGVVVPQSQFQNGRRKHNPGCVHHAGRGCW